MNTFFGKVIFYLFPMIWSCLIFAFSLQPGEVSSDTSVSFGKLLVEFIAPGLVEELASLPQARLDYLHHILRKCAHFTEYLILGILAFLAAWKAEWKVNLNFFQGISKSFILKHRKAFCVVFALLYCILIASLDETIQRFVPGRAGMLSDVLLDCSGALTGILLAGIPVSLKQKHGRTD